ncbi:MAG: molybdopterin-dependent oxidoreductase [Bryobacteraceae bacterium]|nr:molybdopterin-dependent oxidoreductase [Bryobacteraceae bacterium]
MQRLACIALLAGAFAAGQDSSRPAVMVTGDVKQPLTLTAEDIAEMPRASVRLKTNGVDIVYQGVWLHEVLKRAGVPSGSDLRGKALTTYLLAEASDGYQVIFSLAELDPALIENEVLLADTADGKPLSGSQGRFRIIASKEKRPARSVRMLTSLKVVRLSH